MKRAITLSCLTLGLAHFSLAVAYAPVESGDQQGYQNPSQQSEALVPAQQQVQANPQTSQQTLSYVSRIDTLENEVRTLRGQVEEQQHTIEQLQTLQREMYSDLDKQIKAFQAQQTSAKVKPVANNSGDANTDLKSADVLDQQQSYQKAYDLIKARQYTEASAALQDYLQKYPDGVYAVNAHYWLGELGQLAGDNQQASKEFMVVVSKYSKSSKVSDATLKLGFIAYDQGQWKEAREYLTDVQTKYPNSSAAKLATQRLQQMKQEGH